MISSDVIFPEWRIFSTARLPQYRQPDDSHCPRLDDAQIDSALAFINSLTGHVPRRGDQRLFLPKVDWHINSKHAFTATYNRVRWESPAGIQTQATNTRDRASFGDDFVEPDSLNLRLASTLSAKLVNEFRFQWADDNEFKFASRRCPASRPLQTEIAADVSLTNGSSIGKSDFLGPRGVCRMRDVSSSLIR